jgi:hypothetical protein
MNIGYPKAVTQNRHFRPNSRHPLELRPDKMLQYGPLNYRANVPFKLLTRYNLGIYFIYTFIWWELLWLL